MTKNGNNYGGNKIFEMLNSKNKLSKGEKKTKEFLEVNLEAQANKPTTPKKQLTEEDKWNSPDNDWWFTGDRGYSL